MITFDLAFRPSISICEVEVGDGSEVKIIFYFSKDQKVNVQSETLALVCFSVAPEEG